MDIGHFRDADTAVHQGCGNEIRQRELSLHDLRGLAFVRGASELFGDGRGEGGHLHGCNFCEIDRCPEPKLIPCDDGGIEDGMLGAAARIGFEAQLIAAEFSTQVLEQFRRIVTIGLVQLEKPKRPRKMLRAPVKPSLASSAASTPLLAA